jgi:hypothetical protein
MTTDLLSADLNRFIEFVRGKIVERFAEVYDVNLECGCAVSSYTLYRALLAYKVNASFVQGVFGPDEDHCWVLIEDRILVDITARQFSSQLPVVLVTTVDDQRYRAHRVGFEALRHILKNWPDDQTPNSHRHRISQVLQTLSCAKAS